jgi:hypothetical protein
MFKAAPSRNKRSGPETPDLQTQFESMLDEVWKRETQWRLNDRIDAFCASQPDHCGVGKANR